MSKVNVYASNYDRCFGGSVIARVNYNALLDHWDGNNWSDGGVGTHLGITQLRDGRYVLIHGTQWQGCSDWAETVTDEEALQAILKSGNAELLDKPKFKRLKDLSTMKLIPEAV